MGEEKGIVVRRLVLLLLFGFSAALAAPPSPAAAAEDKEIIRRSDCDEGSKCAEEQAKKIEGIEGKSSSGAKSGGHEGGASVSPSGYDYVAMEQITLPIITDKGVTQQLSLDISLEVEAGAGKDIAALRPKLADAYIQDLYGALGAGHAFVRGDIIDVRQIKKRLVSVTDKVLGAENRVHDVLLEVVKQRAL